MGGASPYRSRLIALTPCGQNSSHSEGVPCDSGEKYSGLVNTANTCYVNSVLQALYFRGPFRKAAIHHLAEEREDNAGGDSLLLSMAELFAQIEGQKKTVGCLTPRRFLAKLRKANDLFCNSEHQDAHEFMQFLLNDIVDHVKKRLRRQHDSDRERQRQQNHGNHASILNGYHEETEEEEPRTWVHDIFQGYLVNQIKCLCCENVTVRRETFLDLSVDIERHTSVAACLRTFESTELLRAGNKFFCDSCACLQEAEKRLRVYQLPSVLTLHLKRFKYVERLDRCCRLPYRVVFPLQLRVIEHRPQTGRVKATSAHAPQTPARAGAAGGNTAQQGSETGSAATADTLPADGEDPAGTQTPSRLFELRSVVVHIGRDSTRGHYVTVVRQGERCVLLDDDVVRVVEPEVLRSFYGTAGTPSSPHQTGGAQVSNGQQHAHQSNASSTGGTGWGAGTESADGDLSGRAGGSSERYPSQSPSVPLYERSPEGTCCGYLLFYEAVDGRGTNQDAGAAVDVGNAADWISEERNLTDSDSGGESAAEDRQGSGPERPHPNPGDDELTQAFEQRCIPRSPAPRQARTGTAPAAGAAAASQPS